MAELKRCFEAAGFTDVKTVLGSGNVVFDASASSAASLKRAVEAALRKQLGRTFLTIVRSVDALQAILEADPFRRFRVSAGAKRVVTFLREPPKAKPRLPIELHGARILCLEGTEVFTAYVATAKGPAFMTLIEKTFGDAVTT